MAGDFRLNEELFSGQPFDGTAQPLKGLIGLRTVEIGDALVVGIADEAVEAFTTEVELYLSAVAAGAHAQAAELNAGLAQGDLVDGGAFGGGGGERARAEDHGPGGGDGGLEEIPTTDSRIVHKMSPDSFLPLNIAGEAFQSRMQRIWEGVCSQTNVVNKTDCLPAWPVQEGCTV